MMLLFYALLLIALPGARAAPAQALTLDQVVHRAVDRVKQRETERVSAARAGERYLESQSKFHFELRPRAGLLAFSHPALLASSLGFGMLLGPNAPSPWARQNARLDTIAAEIDSERAVTLAEREALRQYFGLWQKQKATDAIRELLEQRRVRLRSVNEKAKATEATALDAAVLETGLITLETQLEDAETQQRIAASALGELLGGREGEELHVADPELPAQVAEVPSLPVLYDAAMREGDTRAALRKKLEAERKRVFRERAVSLTPLSASYAHIGTDSGVGLGQSGLLLGGNTGSLEPGLQISLRAGTANTALAAAAAARIGALEFELADLDDSVRSNVATLRLLVVSSRRKAEQAARKLELAERIERLTSLRERSGLESSQAMITAETDVSRARADLHQAESERDTAWAHLLAGCGLTAAGTDIRKALAQAGPSENSRKIETEGRQ